MALAGFVIMRLPGIKEFGDMMRKQVTDKKLLQQFDSFAPAVGISILVVTSILFILLILHTRAVWKGYRWGMWLHLILNLPGAAAAISLGTSIDRLGSIGPLIVAVYAVLRLTGTVGPKLQ